MRQADYPNSTAFLTSMGSPTSMCTGPTEGNSIVDQSIFPLVIIVLILTDSPNLSLDDILILSEES